MWWQLQEVDFSFNPLTDLSGLRGIHSLKVHIYFCTKFNQFVLKFDPRLFVIFAADLQLVFCSLFLVCWYFLVFLFCFYTVVWLTERKSHLTVIILIIINVFVLVPSGRNFRGAGGRQCVTEKREERKPGRRGMSGLDLNTVTESLLTTVFGSDFQTVCSSYF